MKHKLEKYKDIDIHLMHIGENMGWFATLNGEDYGAFIIVSGGIKNVEDLEEHFSVLFQNARESIDEILKK